MTRRIDVQDSLAEGFTPSQLPPIGADGAPQFSEVAGPGPEPPPRLCEYGPCRHYHQFAIHMDVQQPMHVRRIDGGIERAPDVFHVEVHHYCYPNSGIELELGRLPILRCNRWDPVSPDVDERLRLRLDHRKDLDAWHAARAELELGGASSAPGAPLPTFAMIVEFDPHLQWAEGGGLTVEIAVTWETTMRELCDLAFARALENTRPGGPHPEGARFRARWLIGNGLPEPAEYRLVDVDGAPIDNLDATVAHLSCEPGGTLCILHRQHEGITKL